MPDLDAFGLRTGTSVSKAASLAARPSGATMGELIDATGDTQYNIFKRLEAKGHSIRRDGAGRGMRIWLKHKDEKVATQDAGLAESDLQEETALESVSPEVERWTLSLERDLQRALRGSLDQLEPGLVAVDNGREDGFRDITAKDAAGNIVVIELKASKTGPEAVAQLLAYMGELKAATNPSGLRGILVAPDFQTKALAAASIVPNIALKRYIFHLTFENAYPDAHRDRGSERDADASG
jgi:hypothetical protein